MNIRGKTLITIGTTLVGLIVILYVVSQTIMMGSFADLEEQDVCENVERVQNTLSDELDKIDRMCSDWAAWDDTYAFIEDCNADYIESNLVDSTFTTLRLDIMLLADSSGKVVYRKAVSLEDEMEMDFPQSFLEHISANDSLLDHKDAASSLTGIVLLPEGPLLVASRPILTSDDEGPIRGALIMGRYFDAAEVERLEEMTQLSLTVCRIDEVQMPPDFETAISFLEDNQDTSIFIQPLHEEVVAGYVLIEDIYGTPILVLRIDRTREIYAQGQVSMRYLVLSLVLVGAVFTAVILLLLESQVLSRLMHLSKSVSSISTRDDLSARVSVTGKDELSNLADEINQMIEAIERSHKKLQDSVREKEVLLKEIHHRVKNNMQIVSSLLNLQSAYIKDESLREIFRESQNRILSMSLVHEKLYHSKDLANIDFNEYIRVLTHDLLQSYGASERIALIMDTEDISLGIDTAIPCGLIINELVSNALEHAFPDREGEIRIALHSYDSETELIVADNGVGMPEDVDFRDTDSLGLRLVTILVEDQLQGTIRLERDGGTKFRITF